MFNFKSIFQNDSESGRMNANNNGIINENSNSQISQTKLKVGVIDNVLPYSSCKPTFTGITVDFWKRVAEKYNLEYEFVCYPRENDAALRDINNGVIDVLLGDISILHRRYDWALYSRPYYVSELYLFRKKENNWIDSLISHSIFLYLIVAIFMVVIVYTLLMMNILKLNFITAIYRALVYFFSTEPDVMPVKLKTKYFYTIKILNTIWQFLVFFLNALVVSIIISTFVKLKDVIDQEELDEITDVNVLGNTSYVDYIRNLNKTPIENNSSEEILQKILKDKNQYWMEDYNIKKTDVQKYPGRVELAASYRPVYNDEYSIAVSKKYPDIIDMINKILIKMQDDGSMLKICKGYMNEHYDRCNL